MNFPSSCLYFPMAGIIGENHHIWLFIYFWHRVGLCSPGWPFVSGCQGWGHGCSICEVPAMEKVCCPAATQRLVKTILTVCRGDLSAFTSYGKAS